VANHLCNLQLRLKVVRRPHQPLRAVNSEASAAQSEVYSRAGAPVATLHRTSGSFGEAVAGKIVRGVCLCAATSLSLEVVGQAVGVGRLPLGLPEGRDRRKASRDDDDRTVVRALYGPIFATYR
jgi:hypothetical protein